MDAKNVTTNLLQISSRYSIDRTWNMVDYTRNITAHVRHALGAGNVSRTWIIKHWQLHMRSMLTAATGTKMDTAKMFQAHYGKPWHYNMIPAHFGCLSDIPITLHTASFRWVNARKTNSIASTLELRFSCINPLILWKKIMSVYLFCLGTDMIESVYVKWKYESTM